MSRTSIATAVLAITALAATFAQAPARDAAQTAASPSGTAGLAGVVRDHNGDPVRRATVRITGDTRFERSTITDNEGKFAFVSLPAGRFGVSAEKPGYPQSSYGARRPFRTGSGVMLQDGQQIRDLALTLGRGASVSGTVYDERGEPMPGVPVMPWEIRTALNGDRTLDYASGFETVTTDDRGMYRVYGLPPGDYTIGTSWAYHGLPYEVRIPTDAEIRAAFQPALATGSAVLAPGGPSAPAASAARYNYSPVFAPGVTDPMGAATLALVAGDDRRGVDLRMQFVQMSGIEGTIVTPDGNPVTGSLAISRRSPVQALNSTSQRPGHSELKFSSGSLSPGPYSILFDVPQRGNSPGLWAKTEVIVGSAEPTRVTLVLQPALTVTGKIVFDGTLPLPADLSKLSVWLRSPGGSFLSPETTTTIAPSGALSITGVIRTEYVLVGTVPGVQPAAPGWRLRSVTVGGRDVTDRRFELGAGVTDLTVTFSDQSSELSGTITTPAGAPATDFFVIAFPADRAYWLDRISTRRIVSARPDRTGQYVFRNLPAGEYRVAVTTDLVPRDLQDASALERLAAQSVAVTIAHGEKKALNLRAGAGERRP